jgi:hypothetical protein
VRSRLAAGILTALVLVAAEGEPSFECAPGVADAGEAITCTGGPFDPGAEAVITVSVNGADTTRSTFDVDDTGQVVRSYVEDASAAGSTFTLTIETSSDGDLVTLQAQYRIAGTGTEEPSPPDNEPSDPPPTGTPTPAPADANEAGWFDDPLGIMVVAAAAAAGLLLVGAVVAERRRRRENR